MHTRSKGFTLVELMIGLSIGLVIVGAILYVFLSNSTTFRMSQAQSQVQDSGRFTLEFLSREIRHDRYSPIDEFCSGGGPSNLDISVSITSEVAPYQLRFATGWDYDNDTEKAVIDRLMEAFSFEEEANQDPIVLKASDVSDLTIKNTAFANNNIVRVTSQSNVHSVREYTIANHDVGNIFFELENEDAVVSLQRRLVRQKENIDRIGQKQNKTDEDNQILTLEQVLIALEEDCIRGSVFRTDLDLVINPTSKEVSFNVPNTSAGIGYNYKNGNIIVAEDLYTYIKERNSYDYYFIDQPSDTSLPSLYHQVDNNDPELMVSGIVDFAISEITNNLNQGVVISFTVASEISGFAEANNDDNSNPDKRLEQPFMTSTIRRN